MTIEEAIRHAKVTAKLKYNEATMHRSYLDNEQCNNESAEFFKKIFHFPASFPSKFQISCAGPISSHKQDRTDPAHTAGRTGNRSDSY